MPFRNRSRKSRWHSTDDQWGAFYVFRLPPCWRAFMTFQIPIPGHLIGSTSELAYVAAAVIPMGWIDAVPLFQHLQRQLAISYT